MLWRQPGSLLFLFSARPVHRCLVEGGYDVTNAAAVTPRCVLAISNSDTPPTSYNTKNKCTYVNGRHNYQE